MVMETNAYNCNGNMWSNGSDSFHTSPLDLPDHVPSHRQHNHFMHDVNKMPVSASNPYGMLLNYSQEIPIQHAYHHRQVSHGQQWQFPQWQSVKTKINADPRQPASKHFPMKSCDTRNFYLSDSQRTNVDNLPTQNQVFELFTPNKACDQITDYFSKGDRSIPQQNNSCALNFSGDAYSGITAPSVKKSARRKNPAPKKRKAMKKKSDEKKTRTRNEEKWVRNLRKKARAKGESYISVLGKTVPARAVKPVDCSKCKFHCPDRVSENDRQNLFETYWGLGTFKEKVEFICNSVQEFAPLRPISGRRAHSRRYKLKVKGQEERVCKEFFLSTFDISESTIVTYMNKKRENPEIIQDLRGKRSPSNKTPERVLRDIREHILSQIGLQGTLDKLPPNDVKNVKNLYALYQAECEQENDKPASLSMYRKIFTDMHRGKNGGPIQLPSVDFLKDELKKGCKNTISSSQLPVMESFPSSGADCELSSSSDIELHSQTVDNSSCQADRPAVILSSGDLNNSCTHEFTGSVEREAAAAASMLTLPFASGQQYYHPQHAEKYSTSQSESQQQASFHQDRFNSSSFSKSSVNSSQITPSSNIKTKLYNHQEINKSTDHLFHSSDFSKQCDQARTSHSLHQNHPQPVSNFTCPLQSQFSSSLDNSGVGNFPYILPMQLPTSEPNTEQGNSKSHHKSPFCQKRKNSHRNRKETAATSKKDKNGDHLNSKSNIAVKKRERKEETWARNIRKRLRFKGEEYTSVRGKKVEAKKVQDVDCSKCRFKCQSKMSEQQREETNSFYWSLESLEKRIAFISKHVQLYKPKRLMTGRRAFSRRYVFEVDRKEVRVCKDFFQATLHISESTVATALEKNQKGPDAIKDFRGKHKPANKTTEETVQSICELIIFITGLRPNRKNENQGLGHRIKTLYQAYKYDSQSKGKKVASLGIFRSVLSKEFGISGNPKFTKAKKNKDIVNSKQSLSNSQGTSVSSTPETSEQTTNIESCESDRQALDVPVLKSSLVSNKGYSMLQGTMYPLHTVPNT